MQRHPAEIQVTAIFLMQDKLTNFFTTFKEPELYGDAMLP